MENYIEQLTAKNSEYVHVITRELVKVGKSDEEIKVILSEILPQIVEAQEQRILAKDILGTPSEFTAKYAPIIANKNSGKVDNNSNETPVLMWLDSSLLMLGFIAILNGVMSLFSKNAIVYGIITLVTMSLAAGFVIYLMYRLVYKPQSEGRKRPGFKAIGLLTLTFLVWIALFTLTSLLPKTINIALNSYIVLAIGLMSLGGRYLLKRKYHIKSAMATQPVRK